MIEVAVVQGLSSLLDNGRWWRHPVVTRLRSCADNDATPEKATTTAVTNTRPLRYQEAISDAIIKEARSQLSDLYQRRICPCLHRHLSFGGGNKLNPHNYLVGRYLDSIIYLAKYGYRSSLSVSRWTKSTRNFLTHATSATPYSFEQWALRE